MTDASTFLTIAALLPELDAAQQAATGLKSPRITSGGGGDSTDRLPFGLASRIDDPNAGPDGARTVGAILAWSAGWAFTIAGLRGERVHATALTYLATTADWAASQYGDWESLAEEADAILNRLNRITGHTPQVEQLTRCPSCGSNLTRESTDEGLSDAMACTHCGETYADDGHAQAVRRVKIKTSAADTWVTREQARNLWPNLRPDLLRQWIKRGHIATHGNLIHLGDLNARARHAA